MILPHILPAILAVSALGPLGAAPGPLQPPDAVGKIGLTLKPNRSVIYKEIGDRRLRLDIFEPKGFRPGDRRPCFVAIHGGGWKSGNPSWMYPFLTDLVELGMVGISVEYRLLSESTTVFDCVKDARSAIRYVRAHAAKLGIDPDKIIVCGSSAGGLLAVDLLFPNNPDIDNAGDDLSVSCAPDALVLHYPVVDTSTAGYGNAKIGEKWEELSPLAHVRPGMPPTLIFHGTGDKLVPFKGAQNFHDAMVEAGNRCEIISKEGKDHGYLRKDLADYEETRTVTREFLASLGYLKSTKVKSSVTSQAHGHKISIPTADLPEDAPRRGGASRNHFAARIGTCDDIVKGREGRHRLGLLHNHALRACGHPGLELPSDGTFVSTTCLKYREGPDGHSVVSARFDLEATDVLAAKASSDQFTRHP